MRYPAVIVSLGLCLASVLGVAKDDALDRVQPVPSGEPIPMSDYFRPSLFRAPSINRDGTHFAAIFSDSEDRACLLLYDIKNGKGETIGGAGNIDVYSYTWLAGDYLLYGLLKDKMYILGTCVAKLGHADAGYQIEQYNAFQLVGVSDDKPLHPVIWLRNNAFDGGKDGGLLRIDASRALDLSKDSSISLNGLNSAEYPYGTKAHVIESFPALPEGTAVGYVSDVDGKPILAHVELDGVIALFRLDQGHWVRCPVDLDKVEFIGVSDNPNEIIVNGLRVDGRPRPLQRMNYVTGELGEVLYQDEHYDINNAWLRYDPVTHRLIGITYHRLVQTTVWFDEKYQALQKRLEASLPFKNVIVTILNFDRSGQNFLVSVESDRMPITYFRVDLEGGQLGLIKGSRPWIDPQRMQPMRPIAYKTRDGIRLEGYLTLPAGASKEAPAPMIVLPHGGPWVRDTWAYSPDVQYFASLGYAVFQPNYRGSPGYDWRCPSNEFGGQWDFVKMHEDVTDGVKAVCKNPLIDAKRVAIMGGSFGGYLALCGATREGNLYRCAVTIAGVFDWERVLKDAKNDERIRGRYGLFLRNLGDPKKNKACYDEVSPLRHIDQVKIPVFVTHGKDDFIAQASQSRRLVDELEKHHVPYEKLFVGGEGHGFAYYKNRMKVFTAISAFLEKNLAPLPAEPAPTDPTR